MYIYIYKYEILLHKHMVTNSSCVIIIIISLAYYINQYTHKDMEINSEISLISIKYPYTEQYKNM